MSCCKGYRAMCIRCGFKGCSSCQVTHHEIEKSYCSSCFDIIQREIEYIKLVDEIDRLKKT